MQIIIDEVQAEILIMLIKGQFINSTEQRELISVLIELEEKKGNL